MTARSRHTRKTVAPRTPESAVPFSLVTLRQAAALLSLSPRTLARLVTLKRVPSYRFAGVDKLLFKTEELLALLQPTTVQSARSHRASPSSEEAP